LLLRCLAWLGVRRRPRWLIWFVRRSKTDPQSKATEDDDPNTLNFWLLNIDGELTLPKDDNVDVEMEIRRRLETDDDSNGSREHELDSHLYKWWLKGGWWGTADSSGSYNPESKEIDEDTTSVISFSTESEGDWESDEANDDGQRTPTQRSPQPSRESTPFLDTPLNPTDLAQLLHPRTPEQRAEAQALSLHLRSDKF
jgi:hypothetical protein